MFKDAQIALLMILVVGSFIVAAMVRDLKCRRLPNVLTMTIAIVSIGLHTAFYGLAGFSNAALGLLIGFGLFLPFYLIKMMGAGDLKLIAALGAFLGAPLVLPGAAAGVLIGGVHSLYIILRQKRELAAQRWALISAKFTSLKTLAGEVASYKHLAQSQHSIPYGVYLGIGALGTATYNMLSLI